jgi:hypothetical protein
MTGLLSDAGRGGGGAYGITPVGGSAGCSSAGAGEVTNGGNGRAATANFGAVACTIGNC